jgi:hypothetical protein
VSLAEEERGADSIFGGVERHVHGRLAASNHYNLEKKIDKEINMETAV